ncbi:MAG TPA: YihY/virulence factor BrkB family protein, partial [Longimicrobiales bacterium]
MKKSWSRVLKHTWSDFGADRCTDLAAALSYYTIFSIPPLIMLTLLALGLFVDAATIQSTLQGQAGTMIGPQGEAAIQAIMKSAHGPNLQRPLTAVIGVAGLLLSAIGFFLSLQSALNRSWDVAPDPKLSIVKNFLLQRLAGFIMLVVIAAVLIASVVASALISAFGGYATGFLPSGMAEVLLQAINFLVTLAVTTVMFALIFKLLPDAAVHWRDVWIGGLATALLFTVGKLLIGLYLGHSNPGSAFGAAGSVILLLVWIYYSSV